MTGGAGDVCVIPCRFEGLFYPQQRGGSGPRSAKMPGSRSPQTFQPGDMGPVFTNGAGAVFATLIGNMSIRDFVTQGDQAVIDYVNATISAGNQLLPPAAGQAGHALIAHPAWSARRPRRGLGGLANHHGGRAGPDHGVRRPGRGESMDGATGVRGRRADPGDAGGQRAAEVVAAASGGGGHGAMNFDAATAGIAFYPAAATANFSVNFRGSAARTLANFLAVGDGFLETFTLIAQQGASVFTLTAISIDGVAQAPLWQTGVQPVPVSGTVSIYTVAIRNNGGGNYTVLASMTRWG